MSWKSNWIEGIEDDFSCEKELLRAKAKVDLACCNNPYLHTEKIKGVNIEGLRKITIGDHRLFILLNDETENMYCLSYLPRKNCYNKISLNKVLTIIKNIST